MCRIKSLILLLASLLLFACASNNTYKNDLNFSLGYIGDGYQGLILTNLLDSYLKSYNYLDERSEYEIQASIGHSANLYVTNIDNTSDRENIRSSLSVDIYDLKSECVAYSFSSSISSSYIFASGEKFLSNKEASKEIQYNNTEELVKKFVSKLMYARLECAQTTK